MTNEEKERAKAVAASGAGAGVGGAGAATIGILELAAQGLATNLLAGIVVGAGAVFGGLAGYSLYRLLKTGGGGARQGNRPLPGGKPDAPPAK